MPPEPPRTRWLHIMLLVAAGYAVSLQAGKLPAALPVLTSALDLDLVSAGWLLSAVTVVAAAFGITVGSAATRVGVERMMLIGLALNAVGSAIGAVAPGVAGIAVSRVVEGAGFIAAVVSIPQLLLALTRPADQTIVMGVWTTYFPVGMALMLLTAPGLLAIVGWRGLWAANATAVAALGMLVWKLAPAIPAPQPTSATVSRRSMSVDVAILAKARSPLWLGVGFASYAGLFLAVMAFLPVLLIETARMTMAQASLATAIAVLLNGGGNVIAGLLLRCGATVFALMAAASLAMGFGTLVIFDATWSPAVRIGAACLFCFVGGSLPAATFARVPTLPIDPALRPVAIGLVTQAAAIGQLAGPPLLAGMVKAGGSWSHARLYAVAAAALCMVAAWRATKDRDAAR